MVDLDSPPAVPVDWDIRFTSGGTRPNLFGISAAIVFAVAGRGQTAWLAYHDARERYPLLPPFGSCVVERVGGGK